MNRRAQSAQTPADLHLLIKEGGYRAAFVVAERSRRKPVLEALADRLLGTRRDLFFPAMHAALALGQGKRRLQAVIVAKDRLTNVGLTRIERALLCISERPAFRPLVARWLAAETDPRVAVRLLWARVHTTANGSADRLASIMDVLARFSAPTTRKAAMRALGYCAHASRGKRVSAFLARLTAAERRAFRPIARYAT